MIDTIYNSDKFKPDQIKIYPCEVVPWTKIEKWYNDGKYKPYGEDREKINTVLKYALTNCPPHVRLPRVIRDIPHSYINGGVKCSNLRQLVNNEINSENLYSNDIRFREIGRHPEYTLDDARLFVRKYDASNGMEYFISIETYDKKAIFGFLRLRIPFQKRKTKIKDKYGFMFHDNQITKPIFNETLKNIGLIRELHVLRWG